jgi:DUF917 family protein
MRTITRAQLDDIAVGATVLGTGGGGDPYVGKLMAAAALDRYGPITLIDPDELADDALVIPVGMMGAPTVMVEKIPEGREASAVVAGLEAYLGKEAGAVMPSEAGGINSTLAFVVAAARGLPLVDADLVGRAFPELQMCTPTLYGTKATPLAMADDKGNSDVLNAASNRWAERIARSLTVQMGCWAMVALYPMTGKQAREQCVLRTVSTIERIGATLREAREAHLLDPVEAVRAVTGGYLIWQGKIVDVARRTVGGFARGEVAVAGTGAWSGQELTIGFQNEFLIARTGSEVLTVTPDLITILDAETGEPITTETLRYGFRVAVLAIPGNPHWRSAAGLQVVGPGYFGYDVPFMPVEEIMARTRDAAKEAA